MDQYTYYRIRTMQTIVNILVILSPVLFFTIFLLLFNISNIKKELRNTQGLNFVLEENVTNQAYEIRKLNEKLVEVPISSDD